MSKSNLYIVEGSMLPEVFLKVCEAKEYLQTGAAGTVAEAVSKAGISRSAFYKYKDAVQPFRDLKRDRVITMSILTMDRPGALSSVPAVFAGCGANILTINQSIPTNGVGIVTISITTEDMNVSTDELHARVDALPDVVKSEILAVKAV